MSLLELSRLANDAAGAMTLYLIRHPTPAIAAGICYGRTDVPCDDNALLEAVERIAAALPREVPIVASPLERCRSLAQGLAAQGHAGPLRFDARLTEMNFGVWEGRAWSAIERSALDAWSADVRDFRPPLGETVAEVEARCMAFIDELLSDAVTRTAPGAVALITHTGPIRILLSRLCGVSLLDGAYPRVRHGSITVVDAGVHPARLVAFDTLQAHLGEGDEAR